MHATDPSSLITQLDYICATSFQDILGSLWAMHLVLSVVLIHVCFNTEGRKRVFGLKALKRFGEV